MPATRATLDEQFKTYLAQLNSKQKRAVLLLVKTFAEGRQSESMRRNGPVSMVETDKRSAKLQSPKQGQHKNRQQKG